jgi:hypothetical protein
MSEEKQRRTTRRRLHTERVSSEKIDDWTACMSPHVEREKAKSAPDLEHMSLDHTRGIKCV